ncbi:hypothetical protein [Streptomyces sp. NPDC088762]|uniref:hypothetical protein n=1 Tax=Streptomyces sp. NPDC088762 TaxID=3365891 RepID=UPI00381F7CA0
MSAPEDPDEPLEPLWMLTANVVLWRRWGEGGQGLRPGTKTFRGGARVHVFGIVDGEDCLVVGRPRHAGRYVSGYVHIRHLHTFRPKLVRSPAVLRAAEWSGFWGPEAADAAAEAAPRLERRAWELRSERWPHWPHPEPCLCHECAALAPAR